MSQLHAFDGDCRYRPNNINRIKELGATNAQSCYEQCEITDGCTAFAYKSNAPNKDCNLYREGPYTFGSGRENQTCYIMPRGNSTCGYSNYMIS